MSLAPITLRRLLRELNKLSNSPPEGIRLSKETFDGDDGEADLTNIYAYVAGPPGTPFEGGYFKIRFSFGSDYPAQPPKCTFITKIFHPNVNPSDGAICVSTLKKDWKPEFGIEYILTVIKCLLIHPNPASALHAEAGRLLLEAFDDYASRAKLMTSIHATSRNGPPNEFQNNAIASTSAFPSPVLPPSLSNSKPSSSSSSSSTKSTVPFPLQSSSFSNTSSASPSTPNSLSTSTSLISSSGKPSSAGKKRTVSNISNNLESVSSSSSSSTVTGGDKLVKHKLLKSSSSSSSSTSVTGGAVVKKRGLKRL